MQDGQRIDWFAIPARYRNWQAQPAWRKVVWIVTRSVAMVVRFVGFAGALLWYTEPGAVETVVAGQTSVLSLVVLIGSRPALIGLGLFVAVAVAAAVLLPHKPTWR